HRKILEGGIVEGARTAEEELRPGKVSQERRGTAGSKTPATCNPGSERGGLRRFAIPAGVGAVPTAIPPRQVPARALGKRRRHEIKAVRAQRMAAAEPRQGHPAAPPQAETADSLAGGFGPRPQIAPIP